MATTGDVICQKVVEKRESIDRARTTRFALAIMFHNVSLNNYVSIQIMNLQAPFQYCWFRFLDRRFPTTHHFPNVMKVSRVKVALKRVAIDQSCFAPLLTASFLFNVLFIEFRSPKMALERLKRIYPEVMTNNYKVCGGF